MAIAFGTSTSNAAAGSGTQVLNKPASTAQNDLLVAYIAWDNSGGTTITGVPTGWSTIDSMTGNGDLGVAFYSKVAGASEPSTYTWTFGASITNGGIMHRYTGTDTTTPIPAHSVVRSTSGSVTTTAVTVPTNGWFLCFYGDFNLSATFSTPTGLTSRVTNGNQVSFDSNAVDAGSISATTTITSSSNKSYGEGIALAPLSAVTTAATIVYAYGPN